MLSSEIDLRIEDGGVYDIYGSGLSAPRLRVNSGTTTLNLRAQNVLENLSVIDFDSNKRFHFEDKRRYVQRPGRPDIALKFHIGTLDRRGANPSCKVVEKLGEREGKYVDNFP